jgi:GTP-binding protein
LINMFELEGGGTLVDLPGYGYAKVPGRIRKDWPEMIEGYLLEREPLVQVFVLVDGAIGPTPLDEQMLDWLRANTVPHTVVATKLDKVKSSKRASRRHELAAGCRLDPDDIVWTSATKGESIDHLRALVRTHVT